MYFVIIHLYYFAISQNIEDGEENSTQKIYKYGQIIEVKSDNTTLDKQQIKVGAHFTLTSPSSGYYYAKEVAYVIKHAIYVFL